jgi:hypothetical protein
MKHHIMKIHGEVEVQLHAFLTSAVYGSVSLKIQPLYLR